MANLLNQNVWLPRHDREQLGEQNATASHVVSSAQKLVCFKASELHSIEMAGALRAKLQCLHVARLKQSVTHFARESKMQRLQILHLDN